MPPVAHHIILYVLLSLGLIGSTLWLLWEQRRRWFDDDRLPPQDDTQWRGWK